MARSRVLRSAASISTVFRWLPPAAVVVFFPLITATVAVRPELRRDHCDRQHDDKNGHDQRSDHLASV
jgi:hypothetical protein